MNDNRIMTDYPPISEHDAVNKKYVDTSREEIMGSKVNKAGDVMTVYLNLGENKLKIS